MSKLPKRPRDPAQLAKLMLDIATGEVRNDSFDDEQEESERSKSGRLGGLAGGVARGKKLTPEMRSQIASNAAKARWDKKKKSEESVE
ncbi:hypothetical protein [Vampirovibrio chlorellavorus]|uniref:hypothetical protein n=1 Tax=Vampirovibrio chlorellavorus TaxID=758823 RepID=UPI0026ECB93B|nr:hypothetical protein [Vampirovibrio chlorellavorus]